MPTLVMDPPPAELKALLEHRRKLGLDHRDEMWEGVYRVTPPPSHEHGLLAIRLARLLGPHADSAGLEMTDGIAVGEADANYRAPDLALHRPGAAAMWHPTAALVVEIVSPGDESWEKLPFYAAHEVDEVLIVDPAARSVAWLRRHEGEYRPIEHSGLIELGAGELLERIDWPPVKPTRRG